MTMPLRGTSPTSTRFPWARTAGLGYLVIILAGIFGEFVVRGTLVVPGDPAATASRIAESELLYRAGIAAELLMVTCDVVVALALYIVLRSAGRALALLAAGFRLLHSAIVGVNLLNAYWALLLMPGVVPTAARVDTAQAWTALFLQAHGVGYVIGLFFFGIHCLLLGYLILNSHAFPRVLGGLLGVAGIVYLGDSLARILFADYSAYEGVFALAVFIPAFVAETAFAFWLLIKGDRSGGTA